MFLCKLYSHIDSLLNNVFHCNVVDREVSWKFFPIFTCCGNEYSLIHFTCFFYYFNINGHFIIISIDLEYIITSLFYYNHEGKSFLNYNLFSKAKVDIRKWNIEWKISVMHLELKSKILNFPIFHASKSLLASKGKYISETLTSHHFHDQ